jgi:hypothetical protein
MGRPPSPTRLVAGLLILKHTHSLSAVGRGAVRTLAGESVLPVLLRRIELLPPAAVRPLVADALEAAARRGRARGADPGEPGGSAQEQGAGEPRSRTDGGRHDGAAQGDRPPDRCAAVPPGLGEAGRFGAWRAATVCRYGRTIAGWPSGHRSWSDATATRINSGGRGANSNSCAPGRVIRDIRRKIAGRAQLETRFADLLALAER